MSPSSHQEANEARATYHRTLMATIVNERNETLGVIEERQKRLSYFAFRLMYALIFLGIVAILLQYPGWGFAAIIFGILQYFPVVGLSWRWYMKYHQIAVTKLAEDPEMQELVALYSRQEWPNSKDLF